MLSVVTALVVKYVTAATVDIDDRMNPRRFGSV